MLSPRQSLTRIICVLLLVGSSLLPKALFASALDSYSKLNRAAYLVVKEQGSVDVESRADSPLIPASTVKLITAWLCLEHWGEQHRFQTGFYVDPLTGVLWVEAGGDPFLVSEEIALIARQLIATGLTAVTAIGLDTTMFKPDIKAPGATSTDNPYDAIPTALAANFNTVNIVRTGSTVASAEPQTPLTSVSRHIGMSLQRDGKLRVNTGASSQRAELYFAQLLMAFLKQEGLEVRGTPVWGKVPANADVVLVYSNSRTLGEVVQGMLKYSTNFIANQLILTLVAEASDEPVGFREVNNYLNKALRVIPGWLNFTLMEGAGLSPANRLSARQLVQLLQKFQRWKHLLPEVQPGIMAKTGTLTDVKTLAGYITTANDESRLFAVLLNEPVAASLPAELIRELVDR